MRYCALLILLTCMMSKAAVAGLIIDEFTCGSGNDWVELHYTSPGKDKKDISSLFVTMYYGSNERLSNDPVTIYSYDRPETPYDDRFVVVHLTSPGVPDETDLTGDTNGNGVLDVYCNNYSQSLWNTEGVVAIDTDDDPRNGGIIDFVYYSNRDGKINASISSSVNAASMRNEWIIQNPESMQNDAIFITPAGLNSSQSVIRLTPTDTNTQSDFAISNLPTPGRPNVLIPFIPTLRLIKTLRSKVCLIPFDQLLCKGDIPLYVFNQCSIKYRIFSTTGQLLYKSPVLPAVEPGFLTLNCSILLKFRNLSTGLYICKIEATGLSIRKSEEKTVFIVFSRFR